MNKLAIVIPAYNEDKTIDQVIKKSLKFGTVIVVDDGSSDSTNETALKAGAKVISHSANLGYDTALLTGLLACSEHQYDYAILIDADGQHDIDKISQFMAEFDNGAELVVGSRNKFQRFAEGVFAYLTSKLWDIKDPLCGMKGYRLKSFETFSVFGCYKSIGTEILIRAARSKFRIAQVPIITINRNGASRFGDGIVSNLKIIRAMLIGMILTRKL